MNTVQRIAKNTVVLLLAQLASYIIGFFFIMYTQTLRKFDQKHCANFAQTLEKFGQRSKKCFTDKRLKGEDIFIKGLRQLYL